MTDDRGPGRLSGAKTDPRRHRKTTRRLRAGEIDAGLLASTIRNLQYATKTDYINIGLYTDDMKRNQIARTKEHLDRGRGYMLASTWLQCVPPHGPNQRPGGDGSKDDPGIKWWLEFIRDTYGPYKPTPFRKE